jgi:hypothetical protein
MTPTLALAKKNQLIRVLRRELDRLNTDNSVLRARVAELEVEAEWHLDDESEHP